MGCGGGSGGGTNTVVNSSQPPQWLQNNLQSLYSQAQGITSNPLSQYGGPTVAGFTPAQNTAFNTINSAQGQAQPYYNQAQQLITNASQPITPTPVNASTIAQYQNPYTQQVIGATEQQMQQNDAIQQGQLTGNAIQSGASPFGGDRAGLAAAALAGQQDLANNQTIAGLENQGYSQALGEANTQQQAQLGAQEASQYLGQQGGFGLTNLGTTAEGTALSGASAQLQAGGLQQQLGQEALNVPYEQYVQQQAYPYQQLSTLEGAAGLAGGLAGGTSTSTTPAPSTASQIGGLGLSGLALAGGFKKEGGAVIHRADGGMIPHYDNGGVSLPNVPDLSLSFVNPGSPQIIHGNAPAAPKEGSTSTSTTPGASGGLNLGTLAQAGKGIKNLTDTQGILGSQGAIFGPTGAFSGVDTAISPALSSAMNGADTAAMSAGADSGISSALAADMGSADAAVMGSSALGADLGASALDAAGTTALADAGTAAMSDAAFSSFLDALPMLFALKKGGVPHYDDGGMVGGLAPPNPSSNPLQANNMNQKLAQMSPDQLQQMAMKMPPNSPYGAVIKQALAQKRMMPNVGQGIAAGAPQGATVPSTQMNKGGIAHYDDGGGANEDISPALASDMNNADAQGSGMGALMHMADNQGVATPPSLQTPEVESQKDEPVEVNHSGKEVVVNYPSTKDSINLGLPSQPSSDDSSAPSEKSGINMPLLAAGLGMMAGKSPHALENIGAGGLEGIKQYMSQQQADREAAKEKATEAYQTGELANRNAALTQAGAYQEGELKNSAAKNAAEQQHWKAMEGLQRQRMNSGLPSVDPETGDIIPGNLNAQAANNGFGFPVSQIPPKAYNAMVNEDSKRKVNENNNVPVANNVLRILDQIEPNFKNFDTGVYAPGTRAWLERQTGMQGGTAAANIEKGTNDLATELNKFQYVPGMRGSVLGLQTILASKPGIQQPQQTNENIMSGLRAKITDYQLSSELNEQYREASPYKITDENSIKLDNALKTIYPIEQVDPKTGVTVFNKDNVQKIRQAIPDAIANPKKYFGLASQAQGGQQTQDNTPPQQDRLAALLARKAQFGAQP